MKKVQHFPFNPINQKKNKDFKKKTGKSGEKTSFKRCNFYKIDDTFSDYHLYL